MTPTVTIIFSAFASLVGALVIVAVKQYLDNKRDEAKADVMTATDYAKITAAVVSATGAVADLRAKSDSMSTAITKLETRGESIREDIESLRKSRHEHTSQLATLVERVERMNSFRRFQPPHGGGAGGAGE